MSRINVVDLNVRTLFEQHTVQELLEIEKKLDAEVDSKRLELRSMVGSRYKDILSATEAIKLIENISENIVTNIESVLRECDKLERNSNLHESTTNSKHLPINKEVVEERTILCQIRMAMELNESIWVALDENNYCQASEYYLLVQYVHTGLKLLRSDISENYTIINRLKATADLLRIKILEASSLNLKSVELTSDETCNSLNAIQLLESYSSGDLLRKFIDLRKESLNVLIGQSHPSVRTEIVSIIKCLYNTIQVLYECFLKFSSGNEPFIFSELNKIVEADAPTTLSKVKRNDTNLKAYIPKIIEQFRPKIINTNVTLSNGKIIECVREWLEDTSEKVRLGVEKSLELVPNLKGLQIIREEALKIEPPKNLPDICAALELQKDFNVWFYFIQDSVTKQAQYLISEKVDESVADIQKQLSETLKTACRSKRGVGELDLRWYVNQSEESTVQTQDSGKSLAMKTKGLSPKTVELCEFLDAKFQELFADFSAYVYGNDLKESAFSVRTETIKISEYGDAKKFVDRRVLEAHLKQTCAKSIKSLIEFLEEAVINITADKSENSENKNGLNVKVASSLISARFLTGITELCSNFKRCCTCDHSFDLWQGIHNDLTAATFAFWDNWIDDCSQTIKIKCREFLSNTTPRKMLQILSRWDVIEIQEQTDENTFKSQIKIPMKCSMALVTILDTLTEMLNAVLPHSLHKQTQAKLVQGSTNIILQQYEHLLDEFHRKGEHLSQLQALQFLFDIKYLTTLCVPKENMSLIQYSQKISEKLRAFIDPFDLDVFYKYLIHNVRQSALQSQIIFGCLLPSSSQLASLGQLEKNKEHEKEPSILGISVPSSNHWFLLLPVSEPSIKNSNLQQQNYQQNNSSELKKKEIKSAAPSSSGVRSGAAALFGAMTTDWFS